MKCFKNIKALIGVYDSPIEILKGKDMGHLPAINDAYLCIDDNGRITDYGPMSSCPAISNDMEVEDLSGRFVIPGFVDSHTHIVYAGSREKEFVDKINGLTYEEIAKRGGGILNSADLLHQTSEEELYITAKQRLDNCIRGGTVAMEIKSGYGLSTEDELKMLRVIKRLKENTKIRIKSTFLAAHAFPRKYANNKEGYIDLICNEILPIVAKENLADFVDVFCDKGFFTVIQTDRILKEAARYGIRPKIHANELAISGGVQVGVKNNALSTDHLERIGDEEMEVLLHSKTMPTLLPGTSFFLGIPYGPARKMLDYGLPVALASDYNPGSTPSGSMKFVMSLACIQMKLTPQEAFNAATINAAYALGLQKEYGQISNGLKANIIITKPMPSFDYFAYAYTEDLIERVITY